MKFRINFTLPDGSEDSIVVSGETIEEIRNAAQEALTSRNGSNPWSEEI